MKRILLALLLVALSLMVAVPAFAEGEHTCSHEGTTIQALREHVMHAMEMGHVSQASGQALLGQLDAAQTALDGGQVRAAVKILNAFIKTVNALPASQLEHADCLTMQAENVIAALQ